MTATKRFLRGRKCAAIAAILALMAGVAACAEAQTLIGTVQVGTNPKALALNATTNKIYVVNQNSNNMTVIDGATNHTQVVPTGSAPSAVTINAATNKIYVVNQDSSTVTAVDGGNNRTATITVGNSPVAIAVNAVTNQVYVANYYSDTVTVINGANNHTSTISVGHRPVALAINSSTNRIYVADSSSNSLTVIDGARNSTGVVTVGSAPLALTVNQISNTIYVVDAESNDVAVVDGGTELVTRVDVGSGPAALALNPATGEVYVANSGSDTATIIDGTTLATTTVSAGASPNAIDMNPVTNKAYVTNPIWRGTVTMIDGSNDSTLSIPAGAYPTAIAVNPITNRIYAVNTGDNTVSVIAGASSPALQFIPLTPCRLVDTRSAPGPFGGPYIAGGRSRSFALPQGPCNVPETAQAFSLNVTVVPLQGKPLGYLTIWPMGQSQPVVSTLNSLDGRVKANAAIVPAGIGGGVTAFASNSTDVILDVDGYFLPPNEETLQFYPLTPCRVLDTRNQHGDLGGPYLHGTRERDFPVQQSSCGVPDTAQAYTMNFTVVPVGGKPLGYLTVWPAGSNRPIVSTLNNPTATTVANAAIVPAGTGGAIAVYPDQDTQLVVDINGYFAAPQAGGLSLYSTAPCRVLDTRSSGGAFSGQRNPPVDVVDSPCGIPDTALGYVFNATVVPSGPLGYLTLWPDGEQRPVASTLNAVDAAVTSNMAIMGNDDGKTGAYASSLTQLIMDISSYFAP